MGQELARTEVEKVKGGSLLLGTGLAVASMILVPALAKRLVLARLHAELSRHQSPFVMETERERSDDE
jgi:hypothetical protein